MYETLLYGKTKGEPKIYRVLELLLFRLITDYSSYLSNKAAQLGGGVCKVHFNYVILGDALQEVAT